MANLAKTAWLVALLACLGVGVGAVNAAPVSKTGEQVFITCSACHLPSGEGIPGAFPSLQSLPKVIPQEGGKDYLISVVLQGLNGQIQSNGNTFNGFMQAFAPTFNDEEVAEVLNYVLQHIGKATLTGEQMIVPAEVATIREQIKAGNWPKSHALRQSLSLP